MDHELAVLGAGGRNLQGNISGVLGGKAEPFGHFVQHFLGGVQYKSSLVVAVNLEQGLVEKGNIGTAENTGDGGMGHIAVKEVVLLGQPLERR